LKFVSSGISAFAAGYLHSWSITILRHFGTRGKHAPYPDAFAAANIVEQDHRAIKRRTRPMLGFKDSMLGFTDFNCARVILSGIELMHIIKKRQMKCLGKTASSAAKQFYSLIS
jgi:hypothetical protein